MSLFRLRIRGRLYAGFGALVMFGAAMAGFSVWQLSDISGQVRSMNVGSANTLRSVEIAAELQSMRRAMLRFIFDQDQASYQESGRLLDNVGSLLEVAIRLVRQEDRRAVYREIDKSVSDLKGMRLDLGDTVKLMVDGRAALLGESEKLTSGLQKLVIATRNTVFAQGATSLQSETLLVQVAQWRFLASRDQGSLMQFKTSIGNAQKQIAELEKLDMPASLEALFGMIKANLKSYSNVFDKASVNLLMMDELFYKSVTPTIILAIEKMDTVKASSQRSFTTNAALTDEKITGTITTQQAVAAVAAICGLLIAFLIARGIIGPLAGLTAGMKRLADGDFGVVLPGLGRRDEVGDMAQAVETFKVRAEQKARDEAAARIAEDQTAAAQRRREMIKLADDFEGAVGQIIETVSSASTELEASAGTLTSTAERSQRLTTMVAAASEEASTNVRSVALSTEEMSTSITEIGRQVQESARIANAAVAQAKTTNDRVAELSKAASRIGAVVELINTIAGQTNLLALNATIEAARAGDAGRGFAVVASEVKALAEQTARATGEIGMQISSIQSATDESVIAIKAIGDTIGQMSQIASSVASAVDGQGTATQEIARNVQQAAHGTTQVTSNIADVQRGASETGSASSQVLSAAQSLSSESSRLKQEVSRFLQSVRAA